MKYQVLENVRSISQGDFIAYAENGRIELPEEIAENVIGSGMITPLDTEYGVEQINGGLHDISSSQTGTRKRRKRR